MTALEQYRRDLEKLKFWQTLNNLDYPEYHAQKDKICRKFAVARMRCVHEWDNSRCVRCHKIQP